MRTEQSQGVTLRLVSGGKADNGDALSPFGPVRAGLTIRQPTHDQVLEGLLNSLESRVAMLESKFLGVLNTFLSDSEILAAPYNSINDTAGTKC